MTRLRYLSLALCLVVVHVVLASPVGTSVPDTRTAEEAAQRSKLEKAQRLVADGKATDAIALIDQVLAYYSAKYPEGKTRWYVSRTAEESIVYMGYATVESKLAPGKSNARSLMVAWADAYFLKGYALNELSRPADAKGALERAVYLSPENATYLIELAEAYKLERDWQECDRLYREAEAAAEFSPPAQKLADRSQAKRGQAFVLVEQGKLDQAQNLLEECLKLNAMDARAKKELEYIAELRQRKKQP